MIRLHFDKDISTDKYVFQIYIYCRAATTMVILILRRWTLLTSVVVVRRAMSATVLVQWGVAMVSVGVA